MMQGVNPNGRININSLHILVEISKYLQILRKINVKIRVAVYPG